MKTKARKWWENHEKKIRIKKIEYLIRPIGVYPNDTYNFITPKEDEEV